MVLTVCLTVSLCGCLPSSSCPLDTRLATALNRAYQAIDMVRSCASLVGDGRPVHPGNQGSSLAGKGLHRPGLEPATCDTAVVMALQT